MVSRMFDYMRLLRDERGTVTVLVAAAMVAIFGFGALSVDVGRAYVTKQRLQDVADAAALAGARFLPNSVDAEDAARAVATANGIPGDRVDVGFPSGAIRVSVSADVHYLFAPVLGFASDTLTASATAGSGGVTALSGGRWDRSAADYGSENGGEVGGDCRDGSGGRDDARDSDEAAGDAQEAKSDTPDGEDPESHPDHDVRSDSGHGESDGHSQSEHRDKRKDDTHRDDGDWRSDDQNRDHRDGNADGEDSGHRDDDHDATVGNGSRAGDAREDRGGGCDESGDENDRDGAHGGDGDKSSGWSGSGESGRDGSRANDDGDGEGRVNGGAVPLAVQKMDFVLGQLVSLKLGAGAGTSGNFHALALGGTGADNYRYNLKYGFPGTVRVGQTLRTEPGNMVGPTEEAIRWRIDQDPAATADTVAAGSPRVMYVVVVDSFDGVHGRGEVTVAGFAAFFIEGYVGNGEVQGRFLKWVATGEGGGPADYGLQQVTLLQ